MAIRARRWQRAATREFIGSQRTWWITLTYRPGPSEPTQRDVQTWLKALRRRDPSIRYLLVREHGERSGRLHWHALLHCSDLLHRRFLESKWKFGHCQSRLAKTAGLAAYMAKYQAKAGKLIASQRYGRQLIDPFLMERPGDTLSHFETRRRTARYLRLCKLRPEIADPPQMVPLDAGVRHLIKLRMDGKHRLNDTRQHWALRALSRKPKQPTCDRSRPSRNAHGNDPRTRNKKQTQLRLALKQEPNGMKCSGLSKDGLE